MNLALVRTNQIWPAAALVLGVVAGAVLWRPDAAPYERVLSNFDVASGSVALALLVAVAAYAGRKYAHRGGYSPEFRMRAEFEAIERAERRVRELRAPIAAGTLATGKDVERAATAILREEGVGRIRRAAATPGAPGEPPFVVRVLPAEPLGRVRHWMHVHLVWGTAFGLVVLVHSGGSLDSTMAVVLTLLALAVWLSGLFGLYAWMRGPKLLTEAERDLSIEEAHALYESLERKLARELAPLEAHVRSAVDTVRAGGPVPTGHNGEPHPAEDLFALAGQARRVGEERQRLTRIRTWMMAWKLAHVPAAIALGVLTGLHVALIWTY